MKSRFLSGILVLLISCLSSIGFAAQTSDSHKYQTASSQNNKPVEVENNIKEYSFNDDIENIQKNADEDKNVFISLIKYLKPKNTALFEDDINEVPIPAALWLFGSAFFSLYAQFRKRS